MKVVDLLLAFTNVALCWWRCIAVLRAKRLVAIAWMLLGYFSLMFIPVVVADEFTFVRGFFDESEIVARESIHKMMVFVLLFNGILVFGDVIWGLLFDGSKREINWNFELPPNQQISLALMYLAYWILGGTWWAWQTFSTGYREYVEGASWGSVFFWASSPLIVLLAMRRQWAFAAVLCVPFLYFCVHLDVRSFALLSLVPLSMVRFYQLVGRGALWKTAGSLFRYTLFAGAALVGVSVFVSQYKTGGIALPDSGMPFGLAETIAMVDKFHKRVGFDGLILYGWNYISPFMKLLGIPKPDISDTPNIIAGLLQGVPPDWPVYFHYPALLWSDAYISFGWYGLALALFWSGVIFAWESVMSKSELLLALLLPYFCWHSYMLVRGAIAIASVPISYSLYLSLTPMLVVVGRQMFTAKPAARLGAAEPAIRPPNLLK